ncbi:MAG: exodeoxyribonuclease III [Pseudomonadales bacterium]|nr:exodeoxyribonuclease III [Pseudomonadales bacterium]
MRILTWNVNGLRACARKGFLDFLHHCNADVLCLQEVRAFPQQLDDELRQPEGWHTHFFPAQRPGYSGVAIYSRQPPDQIITTLGDEQFDIEGRFLMARFGRVSIASVYFPKGSGTQRDNSRVPYKLAFYDAVKAVADKRRKYGPVLITGDFNTAHQDIDLARPATNRKNSGFLPEEREVIDTWLADGWHDVFRDTHPGETGHYSWWRQSGGARENNVGWRIDYVLASGSAARRTTNAFILPEVTGSDHCPVGIDFR